MAYTNYPNGLTSFGVPLFGAPAPYGGPPVGDVFFVQTTTGVDAGTGNGPNYPYKTLSYALTQTLANNGDIIYLMPGSTITVSDATSVAISTAGVTIVGLGYGSNRAVFDFTTANTATIPISGANVSISNCRFRGNFLSIAAAITLTAANFTLDGCLFFDNTSVLNFLNIINASGAANSADGLTATNNTWKGLGTTSVNSFLLSANDIDRLTMIGNFVKLAATRADVAILATVTAGVLTVLNCAYNKCFSGQTSTTGGSLISVGGSTSNGIVNNNYVQTSDTSADVLAPTTSGLGFFNNYVSGVLGLSGFLVPTADT